MSLANESLATTNMENKKLDSGIDKLDRDAVGDIRSNISAASTGGYGKKL
jgi:hypothetical protein